MNILFINTWDTVGGAALCAWKLGSYLQKRGHNVTFIVGNKQSNEPFVHQDTHNRLLTTLSATFRTDLVGLRTALRANDIDFGIGEEIIYHPWFQQADILHCHNVHGGYFKLATVSAISALKPTVWTLHDQWAMMPHGAWSTSAVGADGFYKRDSRLTYPPMFWDNSSYLKKRKRSVYNALACTIVTPSFWLAKKVKQSVLAKLPIHVIHNGVDIRKFRPIDKHRARNKLKLSHRDNIVLLVANAGRRNSQKGWDALEEIVFLTNKLKKDIRFICVGGSQADVRLSGNSICYVPYTPDRDDLMTYYAAADVLLFPSSSENFPLVVLEAQACGLPVVSYDVGGVKEAVLHKKTGYIARYDDRQALVKGMMYILSLSDEKYRQMCERAVIRSASHFSLDKMGRSYEDLYQRILLQKP